MQNREQNLVGQYLEKVYRPWFVDGQIPDNLPSVIVQEIMTATGIPALAIIRVVEQLRIRLEGEELGFQTNGEVLPASKVERQGFRKVRRTIRYGLKDLSPVSRQNLRTKAIIGNSRYFSRRTGKKSAEKTGFSRERFSNQLIETLPKRARLMPVFGQISEPQAELVNLNWQAIRLARKARSEFKKLGPFYGSEDRNQLSFRVAAEPVVLPKELEQEMWQIGECLGEVSRLLMDMPPEMKAALGNGLTTEMPITFRTDAILDKDGRLKVNEIQVSDGADALMTAEQIIYNRRKIENSTPGYYLEAIRERLGLGPLKLALLRPITDPYRQNSLRMGEFLGELSRGEVIMDVLDLFRDKVDLQSYDGYFFSDPRISPQDLLTRGVSMKQRLWAGNWSALGSKLLFALLFDTGYEEYWRENLGEKRLRYLQKTLIPTQIIRSPEEFVEAKNGGEVLKIAWGENLGLVTDNKGVAGPWSDEARWQKIVDCYQQGGIIVKQPFIEPKRISATLLKGGKLEEAEWYNRICSKYVTVGGQTILTACEATLGPKVVPAGRDCCFTAVSFR